MTEAYVTGAELAIVRRALAGAASGSEPESEPIPETAVFIFGSRATRRGLKPHSDLDLLIDLPQRLTIGRLAALKEALSDSSLPFRVDVVERLDLTPCFEARLMATQPVRLDQAVPHSTLAKDSA